MSEDEALCRFGQPSLAKGDACVRAGLPTAPLKKGGVDAFGQVDRYDSDEFVGCLVGLILLVAWWVCFVCPFVRM